MGNSDEENVENCILEIKISQKKVEEFEKDFCSKKLTDTGEEITYKRISTRDSLPYEVTYKFDGDSVAVVRYKWSNLPGQKNEIESRLTYQTELLKKRTGNSPGFEPDVHRKEANVSTRIDFDDSCFWNKTNFTNYAASLYYHDSARQGESNLVLEINFDA